MKYVKLLSKISIVLSLMFLGLGIWDMIDGDYLMGFVYIALGFTVSIQDLINIFNKKSSIKEFIQLNFKQNLIIKEFEHLLKNKDKFYDYSNLMIEALNNSNIQKIRSDVIIDYLKKSSLTKED